MPTMPPPPHAVLVIGGGAMGGALLTGWLNAQKDARTLYVIDTDPLCQGAWRQSLPPSHVMTHIDQLSARELDISCIVVAVKPQHIDDVVAQTWRHKPSCLISVAAGKPLAHIARHAPQGTTIIRAMPNLASAIGKGITALYSKDAKTDAKTDTKPHVLADKLFGCLGRTYWLTEEKRFDVITALCGSGPAYLYYFLEGLTKAGIAYGLEEADANSLSLSMVEGAIALAIEKQETPRALRTQVTSPQGTTAAAMDVFETHIDTWHDIIHHAIGHAIQRSQQLAEDAHHKHPPSP